MINNSVGPAQTYGPPGSSGYRPPPANPGRPSTAKQPQPDPREPENSKLCNLILTVLCYILVIVVFPLLICCFKEVQEYERAVIFRWGRLRKGKARGPGLFFVLPFADDYKNVDMRSMIIDLPKQEILTKDSVSAKVDAIVSLRVEDPLLAIVKVFDYRSSTSQLAQTTLRNVLGTRKLSELLSDRDTITHDIRIMLDEATEPWGVKVEIVDITDVKLPKLLQRSMAAKAEASRDARAKVIGAEGEMKAAKSLKGAAQVLVESPGSLQLRYLQTLTAIGTKKKSTILFPLPMELVAPFLARR